MVKKMAASVGTSSRSISGFDPRSLSGCILWLDAADMSTLFSDAGGTTPATTTVNCWKDKSQTASLFTSSAGPTLTISNTINSRPYLNFNGSTHYLLNTSLSISQPYTVFATGYLLTNTASFYRLLSGISSIASNSNLVLGSQNGNFAIFTGNGSSFNDTNAITPLTSVYTLWSIYSATVTGATVNSFLNGLALNSKTGSYIASTLTGLNIGGGNSATGFGGQPFQGYIGEILIYNYVLSASQRQQVEGYLAWKWGMTSTSLNKSTAITLPVSHAFYNTQPFSRVFNPLDVPGCQLWLDAADKSTFTFSSGTNISSWADKSLALNNFSTTSGTPVSITDGAYSVVSIPSGAIMTSASSISFTSSSAFFVVCKVISISTAGLDYVLAFSNLSSGQAGDFSLRIGASGLLGTPANAGNIGDLSIANYYVNGALNPNYALSIYNNYTIIDTTNPSRSGTSLLTISTAFIPSGQSNPRSFIGNIAEVLYYPAGVTSIQRQQIESYLAWKWSITLATTSQPTFVTTFSYNGTTQTNGTVQSWVCPAGVTSVTVYVWGAGGGGAYPLYSVSGGAGAFVTGTWTTSPGTTYYIAVGAGGTAALEGSGAIAGGWPGGGSSGTSGAAGGGGYSGIFTTSSTPSQANAVVIAGGGGGAGDDPGTDWGGSAYYTGTSQNGGQNLGTGGYGGSLTAGGAAGGTGATAGTALQGGNGNGYSAGGGGGYFGGGGGYYLSSADGCSGGGGGSSYSGGLTNPTGINSPNATGQKTTPAPGSSYQYYTNGVAASTSGQNGGNGLVVIVSAANPYNSYPPSAPTPFYPTHIPGCILWLDAADPSSVIGTTTWNDKSGNTYNATATGTQGTFPTYTTDSARRRCMTFTNSTVSQGNSLSSSVIVPSNTHCLIAVWAPTTITGNYNASPYGGNTSLFRFQSAYYIVFPYMNGATARGYITNAGNTGSGTLDYVNSTLVENSVAGQASICIANITSGSQVVYKNGIQQTTATQTLGSRLSDTLTIGSIGGTSEYFNGNLYEMIIINSQITSSQRATIEGYLSAKWNISLASTHPYYKFQPSQLSPPTPVSTPTTSITSTQLTVSWTASPDAVSYTLILYSQTVTNGALTLVSTTSIFPPALTAIFTITVGTLYTAYVYVVDSAGNSSAASIGTTRLYLATPTMTATMSVASALGTLTTTANFSTVPTGTTYSYTLYTGTSGSGTSTGTTNTTGIFSSLTLGTYYYVTATSTYGSISATGTLATSIQCAYTFAFAMGNPISYFNASIISNGVTSFSDQIGGTWYFLSNAAAANPTNTALTITTTRGAISITNASASPLGFLSYGLSQTQYTTSTALVLPTGYSNTAHTVIIFMYHKGATIATAENEPSNTGGILYSFGRMSDSANTNITGTNSSELIVGEHGAWNYLSANGFIFNATTDVRAKVGWIMMAFAYTNSGTSYYYYNGNTTNIGSATSTYQIKNALYVGQDQRNTNVWGTVSGNSLNADIAFFGMWNTQLTQAQITAFYTAHNAQFGSFV